MEFWQLIWSNLLICRIPQHTLNVCEGGGSQFHFSDECTFSSVAACTVYSQLTQLEGVLTLVTLIFLMVRGSLRHYSA